MPKSHNISKAIDKMNGVEFSSSPATGVGFMNPTGKGGYNVTKNHLTRVGEQSEDAKEWNGWGTALKPACEPIVLAQKPISEKTIAKNVLKYGTGAINIDSCRVVINKDDDIFAKNPHTKGGFGHADASVYGNSEGADEYDPTKGRWPANIILDGSEEVTKLFPNSKHQGNNKSPYSYAGREYHNKETSMFNGDKPEAPSNYNDTGSSARFFYCAKSSKQDRNEGLTNIKNDHATIKPTELMKYLVRLVTPPNGTVLDPFMGSGTTGKACAIENFKFVGIELDKHYFEIAKERIEYQYNKNE